MAGAVVYSVPPGDAQLLLEISGAYTGASLVFEGLPIGGSVYLPLGGVQQDSLSVVSGTKAAPLAISPDGSALGFKFDVSGLSSFRVWASALGAGPVNVTETSGSFFANPPSGAALSYGLQLAILWQLQHLTFLLAISDEKVAASWQPNPILPSGLAASTWDVTG